MQKVFHTRQFKAGNSLAVRIPVGMAFPHQTRLVVTREGDRIIVEPEAPNLGHIPALFAALGAGQSAGHNGERPEFVEAERAW
ncbi:MAG TPA: AbrB/MazE/SpoVT family DNA-binding domain-containing protein [bacterium]|nr:AbrB/MazE/SpoVT family DNA-binding domain-containing protein [bacterium]